MRTITPTNDISGPSLIGRHAQIDGLRVLAMTGVLYVHTWNNQPLFETLRVHLFFIVSGFLITAILLAARDRGGDIKVLNFYVRRLLRLLPALAVLFAVAFIYDVDGFRQTALWHLAQASNILYATQEPYRPWITAQLWSLNVLEQFYLIWPPVILLLSRRGVYVAVLGLLVGLLTLKFNAAVFGSGDWGGRVFAGSPIAMGALFCLLMRVPDACDVILSRGAVIASLGVLASPGALGEGWGASVNYELLTQPALAVLVAGAFAGWRNPLGFALQSAPVQFLSRISYGVYVYHLLVWWLLAETWPFLYPRGPVTFAVVSTATLVMAWASWVLLERPVGALKRYFPTAGPRETIPAAVPMS